MRGATVERSEYPSVCPDVVELEYPSVVCADSRSVYPEVVSECSVVWCLSVGCTDLRAWSVSEYREQQMFGQHGS